MNASRQKGTAGENYFLVILRYLFGDKVERAPLKGTLDYGDYVNVPWLHEAKHTKKPLFLQWARKCEEKAGQDWAILWKGDLRSKGNGPYVLVPLTKYMELVEQGIPDFPLDDRWAQWKKLPNDRPLQHAPNRGDREC